MEETARDSKSSGSAEAGQRTKASSQPATTRFKRLLTETFRRARERRLFVCALGGFALFLVWASNPELTVRVVDDSVANNAFNVYAMMTLLWASGLAATIGYLLAPSSPRDLKVTPEKDEAPFEIDVDYLLQRSDSLNSVIHYLRSGTSLLAAVFTAIIAWILDMSASRALAWYETILIAISSVLVVSAVIAILISFGSTTVVARGYVLREDLLPSGQSRWLFLTQLRECVRMKSDIAKKMKDVVGAGLILFIVTGGGWLLTPLYVSVPYFMEQYLTVGLMGCASLIALSALVAFFGLSAVNILGIAPYVDITDEIGTKAESSENPK